MILLTVASVDWPTTIACECCSGVQRTIAVDSGADIRHQSRAAAYGVQVDYLQPDVRDTPRRDDKSHHLDEPGGPRQRPASHNLLMHKIFGTLRSRRIFRWISPAAEFNSGQRSKPKRPALRLFFATDIHGSDRCFRKFLAAARVYKADVLILGGDVAGKAIVPIVRRSQGRFSYQLYGSETVISQEELESAKSMIGMNGFYPCLLDPDQVLQLSEYPDRRTHLFESLIREQMQRWVSLAEERLSPATRCIITPGNDDPRVVDEVFSMAPRIEFPEGQTVRVGPIWLASFGGTNPTPWRTEREYDECSLADQIDAIVGDSVAGGPLVFNFHCPPFKSGLDTVVQLDEDLRPVIRNGGPVLIAVGSTAIRRAIEKYQPVASLHGHIHKSPGVYNIGRTKCFNPGSDYSSGQLKGLLMDFDAHGGLFQYLFTTG